VKIPVNNWYCPPDIYNSSNNAAHGWCPDRYHAFDSSRAILPWQCFDLKLVLNCCYGFNWTVYNFCLSNYCRFADKLSRQDFAFKSRFLTTTIAQLLAVGPKACHINNLPGVWVRCIADRNVFLKHGKKLVHSCIPVLTASS